MCFIFIAFDFSAGSALNSSSNSTNIIWSSSCGLPVSLDTQRVKLSVSLQQKHNFYLIKETFYPLMASTDEAFRRPVRPPSSPPPSRAFSSEVPCSCSRPPFFFSFPSASRKSYATCAVPLPPEDVRSQKVEDGSCMHSRYDESDV